MRRFVLFLLVAAVGHAMLAAPVAAGLIRSVRVDRQSLNVAAGETVTITVHCSGSGHISILVVDRDGFPVRTLANDQSANGSFAVGWDGRDDNGRLVADEAYSLKIRWNGAGKTATYFPADTSQEMTSIPPRAYSRRTATLTYTLPKPSRVHIQAGTTSINPATKKAAGPVMKTIVNREPRTGGTIAEQWNGFDESGSVFLPDLPDFVVAIAAAPLPDNAIITFGNRERRFVDTLADRTGRSLFSSKPRSAHHGWLPTTDDVSPALAIEPLNAGWSPADRAWTASRGKPLRLKLSVRGPTADAFRRQPANIEVFLDGRRIAGPSPKQSDIIDVAPEAVAGVHRISVNWNSDWGPVAANTIQVLLRRDAPAAGAGQ